MQFLTREHPVGAAAQTRPDRHELDGEQKHGDSGRHRDGDRRTPDDDCRDQHDGEHGLDAAFMYYPFPLPPYGS